MSTASLGKKVQWLEHEIDAIKGTLFQIYSKSGHQKEAAKLKGALEGISVSEDELIKAKKTVFK